MEPATILLLEYLAKGTSALFGVFVALFSFLEMMHGEKTEPVRHNFRSMWQSINRRRWLRMPERIILRILFTKFIIEGRIVAAIHRIFRVDYERYNIILILFVISMVILVNLGYNTFPWFSIYIFSLCTVMMAPSFVYTAVTHMFRYEHEKLSFFIDSLYRVGMIILILLYYVAGVLLILEYLDIIYATASMLIFAPISMILLQYITEFISGMSERIANTINYLAGTLVSFFVGISLSFFITLLFMSLGYIAVPGSSVPQTPQMLVSNVFFDGLTLVFTIKILYWSVKRPRRRIIRIPSAIFIDIFAAAIFACSSIYFGLLFTEASISLSGAVNILIGLDSTGEFWQLGPLFWVMHTTFLPTLLYLCLILTAWSAKALLTPVHLFIGKAAESTHPLGLTAALCTCFTAAFFALGLWAEFAYKLATPPT